MKVEELKEQARRHEQREEWQKAFDLYTTALGSQSEDEAPDIPLLNRLGDIQTRLGQIDGAVGHYEQAIDLYLEAELPNNAIAICKKVLRNLPDRSVFFLRMGQIRASQGFLTDARQNFLEYAERQTAVGDVESALNALVEFVELSPEDVEIRQGLAAQLESHDRTEEAILQYREAYRRFVLLKREEEAAEVSEKLKDIDPGTPLPDPEDIEGQEPSEETEDLVLESTSLGGIETTDWNEEAGLGAVEVELVEPRGSDEAHGSEILEEGQAGQDDQELPDLKDEDSLALAGTELSSLGDETPEAEPEGAQDPDELPTFDFEGEELAEDVEVISSFPGEGVELEGVEADSREEGWTDTDDSLPLISFEEEDDQAEADFEAPDTLPLMGAEGEAETEGSKADEEGIVEDDGLPLLGLEDDSGAGSPEAAVESALEEAAFEEGRLDLGQEAVAEPEPVVAEPEPEVAEPEPEAVSYEPGLEDFQEAAEQGDMALAMEKVRAHILAQPDDVQLHQRLVEYAFRLNDQGTLVSAYLDLAGCLARTESPGKARAVYQQVLSLSPGHEAATAALQVLDGTAPVAPPANVASSEEYVDLGAMILDEDDGETTRWTVAAEAPSGDEEADFAEMLGQFKEKVSEHVAADDVGAHHDLGTAYMEMGLFEEAIGEFQMALRASPSHLPTHEVMGRCWMEMGKADMAVRTLARALTVDFEIEDELIGIYYLMGLAQEKQGNTTEALEFYEKVFSLDINFEDVTERLRALR